MVDTELLAAKLKNSAVSLPAGEYVKLFVRHAVAPECSNAKEMRSILPRYFLPHQAKVGLVHQRRRLQRMVGAFASQVDVSQLMQFRIDPASSRLLRREVALLGSGQQFR